MNILVENKVSVESKVSSTNSVITSTFHIKTNSLPWLWVLFLGSNNDDDPILIYCFSLTPNFMNSQWHLTVSRLEQKILKFFCKHKKNPQFRKTIKHIFKNKNFRVVGNFLWKNCLNITKFQFTISRRPWHGMALFFSCYLEKFSYDRAKLLFKFFVYLLSVEL